MSDPPRRKSPRAPSIPLDEAIERALRVYEKERRHAAPVEIVAQDMGYKSANNGAALAALASLRYYGLLERPEEGKLAVTKNVESYNFAPSEQMRHEILIQWLKTPQIFSDLLEKYDGGLPSDGNLRFDLIQRGFNPSAAESVIAVFKRSIEFSRYFDRVPSAESEVVEAARPSLGPQPMVESETPSVPGVFRPAESSPPLGEASQGIDLDRIPVRLAGGRRAWLLIPSPFFLADKHRLKAQIDLLLAEDEEEA